MGEAPGEGGRREKPQRKLQGRCWLPAWSLGRAAAARLGEVGAGQGVGVGQRALTLLHYPLKRAWQGLRCLVEVWQPPAPCRPA